MSKTRMVGIKESAGFGKCSKLRTGKMTKGHVHAVRKKKKKTKPRTRGRKVCLMKFGKKRGRTEPGVRGHARGGEGQGWGCGKKKYHERSRKKTHTYSSSGRRGRAEVTPRGRKKACCVKNP